MIDLSKEADNSSDSDVQDGESAVMVDGDDNNNGDDDDDDDGEGNNNAPRSSLSHVQHQARRMRRKRASSDNNNKQRYKTRPIDVAEILVAPVSATYSVPCVVGSENDDPLLFSVPKKASSLSSLSSQQPPPSAGNDDNQQQQQQQPKVVHKEKMAVFWVVVLKTRKCYNFNKHLESMINDLDKEEKSRVQKLAAKEFVDVMNMMREVFLFQYKNSPNVITHLKKEGVGSRVDPFQRLSEMCTPDSLDGICSVYEAYRSIIQQIEDLGTFFAVDRFLFSVIQQCSTPSAMQMLSCLSKKSSTLVSGSPWNTPNA